MKTAIVAGASGLVGSFIVRELLKEGFYDEVKMLVRKPMEFKHPTLKEVIYDYEHPEKDVIQADHVYCCLGTTMKKAGSKENFRKVDYHYPFQLAQMANENGSARFSLVSAMGANTNSVFFYNKVKGQIEGAVKDIPFHAVFIMRPSMLLGPRKEFRVGEEIGKNVMKALRFFLPANYKPVHAYQVAACMIDKMQSKEEGFHIVHSGEMQQYPVRQ
jgi:uncharacterized protein YbjT (DUF2867 family)